MNEEARELVQKLLQEGKRYDDVRRELISQGFGTEGFEEEYPDIQKELGIIEPPPTPVTPLRAVEMTSKKQVEAYAEKYTNKKRGSLVGTVIKVLVGLLILGVAVMLLSGYGKQMDQWTRNSSGPTTLNPGDYVHQGRLESLQTAAESFKRRTLEYGGVCDEIGMNQELYDCHENSEDYAIHAKLSDGTWYCVDSAGFSGVVEEVVEETSCQ